jgi:hypothetical protein
MDDPTDRVKFETEMLRYMSPGSLERFGEGYAFHNISWVAWKAALATQRAEIERLKIRCEAYENAYRIAYQATYQSHSGHWDATGQHGAGCPQCIRAREARSECDAALRDGLDKLIERAKGETDV